VFHIEKTAQDSGICLV